MSSSWGAARFEQTIPRDPALFYWIIAPITVVMILVTALRLQATVLLQTRPEPQTVPELRQANGLARGRALHASGSSVLTRDSFAQRRRYLTTAFANGDFIAPRPAQAPPDPDASELENKMANMDLPNTDGMVNMLKGQMVMMLPQTLIMGWVNAFFSGYVILKIPFALTPRFKPMLQSGVGTRDLDARWVSSLSWYFLTIYGLQPINSLIMGGNAPNMMAAQMQMPQMPMGQFGPQTKPEDLFKKEIEELEVVEPHSILDGIENRLLSRLS